MYINQDGQHALRAAAQRAVEVVTRALGSEHHGKGIYLRSFHFSDPQQGYMGLTDQLACWVGGGANTDKAAKYRIVAAEKAIRLATNAKTLGHLSSWESRDPTDQAFRDKFGGATMVMCSVAALSPEPTPMLTSASGLPEMGDEAFTILVPMFAGWKPRTIDVLNILLKSKNDFATRLFQEHIALAA